MPGADGGEWLRPFDCFEHCLDKRTQNFDDGERSSRGCSRHDLQPIEWDIAPGRLAVYMGRPERFNDRHKPPMKYLPPDWWLHPPEEEGDGCPASWILSRFAISIRPYLRKRDQNGGRVHNPRFASLDDRALEEAVLYFEHEQERLHGYISELESKRIKALGQRG